LAKTTPLNPPIVNITTKPNANSIDGVKCNDPPYVVANQLNILIPVGTAIIKVAAVKYALVSTSKPTVYIWCDQTTKPKTPIDIIA
jgi:hypothetical protein